MLKKKVIALIVFCVLFSLFCSNFVLASIVTPTATAVVASEEFYYDPWCPDWGIKRQYFTLDYRGDEYEGYEAGSTFQAVEKQDVYMWRDSTKRVIWPPEIGNGSGYIIKAELQTSSGTTKQTTYSWADGLYRSVFFNSNDLVFFTKKNPLIQAFPGGSYKIKVTATHNMPEKWVINPGKTVSITTNTF